MMRNLCGAEGFRRGCDLYFERHDGQAVTTDDFVKAMEDANGIDLRQFRLWYSQAGTPVVKATSHYDSQQGRLDLTLEQSCPPTPGQDSKQPFHIPVEIALLDDTGRPFPVPVPGETQPAATCCTLALRERSQTFSFSGIERPPVVSLLRGFSAPVKLDVERSNKELAFLLAHDPDPFNRWDAGQTLAINTLLELVGRLQNGAQLTLDDQFVEAFRATLEHTSLDPALITQALTLPSESYLADQCETVDVDAIYQAREFVRNTLADRLQESFARIYRLYDHQEVYRFDADHMAQRSLKNLCLGYLTEVDNPQARQRCLDQLQHANNMTDTLAALSALAQHPWPEREQQLHHFYTTWQRDPQVVDKWFGIQAGSRLPDTLERVKKLLHHPAFRLTNPNKVRALIGRFCMGNPVRFHAANGEGYHFLADQVIELDGINPQMAARLVSALSRWKRFDTNRQALMQTQLNRIVERPKVSRDVFEIVSKSLNK
jgi:aminopeptidase N